MFTINNQNNTTSNINIKPNTTNPITNITNVNTKTKQSFTLVELSVVIVILSVLLTTVLASKSLITSAKINKVYEEYRMYNNSINLFYDRYGCMPGDCKSTQIQDLTTNMSPVCIGTPSAADLTANSESYNTLNTGVIESTTKRTCMFQSLQAAGFISNEVSSSYNTGSYPLTDSIAGSTIPFTIIGKSAWDFRRVANTGIITVVDPATTRYPLPVEIGLTPMTNWVGNHMFTIRDANTTAGLIPDASTTGSSVGAQYAVSANFTQKLDSKFDDGKPYEGNITGGINLTQWQLNAGAGNTGSAIQCNTLIGASVQSTASAFSDATYISSDNIAKGCLVAFLVNSPV